MFSQISETGWYLIGSSLLFLLLFFLFILFYIKIRQRQNEALLREQKNRSEYEEALLKTQLEIQEQTLKNISEEIHDNIGQVLSLAKLNLNTLDASRPAEMEEKIVDSRSLVSKAIQDLRDLSRSMNTDNIESIGLLKALENELDMIRKSGYQVVFEITGRVVRLEPRKELILFRIIQESFQNIIKHAEASAISVSMQYETESIRITVTDNGKGIEPETTRVSSAGLGIRNMENRARLIGAAFHLTGSPGTGTTLQITIPFTNS